MWAREVRAGSLQGPLVRGANEITERSPRLGVAFHATVLMGEEPASPAHGFHSNQQAAWPQRLDTRHPLLQAASWGTKLTNA